MKSGASPAVAGYFVEVKRGATGKWKRAGWIEVRFCSEELESGDALRLARNSRDRATVAYRKERFRIRTLLTGKITR